MILAWVRQHALQVPDRFDRAALRQISTIREARPLGVDDAFLLALRCSPLFSDSQRAGGKSPCRSLSSIPELDEANRTRLLAKGQALFDHCLLQRSIICTTGFVEHEMSKRPAPLRAMIDFVSEMVQSRLSLAEDHDGEDGQGEEIRGLKIQLAEQMIFESLTTIFSAY